MAARTLTPAPFVIRDQDDAPLAVIVAKTAAEARDHYLRQHMQIKRIDATTAFRLAASTALELDFAKPEYDVPDEAQQDLPLNNPESSHEDH